MKTQKNLKKILGILLAVSLLSTLLTGVVVAQDDLTEELKALKLQVDWQADIIAGHPQLAVRMGLTAAQSAPLNSVQPGDKLIYDIYIPSNGNYVYSMGAFDGQSAAFADTGYWFPPMSDQNGNPNFSQLDTLGTDQWMKREFTFATAADFWHLGPAVITGGTDLTSFSGKSSVIYFRNIFLRRTNGDIDIIYDGTGTDYTTYTVIAGDGAVVSDVSIVDGLYEFQKSEPFDPSDPVVPDGVGYAIEFATHFKPDFGLTPIPDNGAYYWYSFGNTAGLFGSEKVKSGAVLSYELFIPDDSEFVAGMGLINFQVAGGNWTQFAAQSNLTDQNGNVYGSDYSSIYGKGEWILLEFEIPESITDQDLGMQHIGPRMSISATDLNGLEGKLAYFYLRNLKIINENSEILVAPPQTNLYNVNTGDDTSLAFSVTRFREVNIDQKPQPVVDPPHETPSDIGHALKFEVQWQSGITGKTGTIFSLDSINGWEAFSHITIENGDKLAYDFYLPSDGNPIYSMGSMDLHFANPDETNVNLLRQISLVDQEGIAMFADLNLLHGTDQWFSRELEIEGLFAPGKIGHVGPAVFHGLSQNLGDLADKISTVYYRNIRIIHSDGSESVIFGENSFLESYEGIEKVNTEGGLVTVLTELNRPTTTPGDDEDDIDDETQTPSDAFNYPIVLSLIIISFIAINLGKRKISQD